jgi:hypothetical protein
MPARSDWCFAHSRGPLSPRRGYLAGIPTILMHPGFARIWLCALRPV